MPYGIMADLVTALHACFVLFVVVGLVAVLLGWARGWSWVRNAWFRATHLIAIAVVVGQAWVGQICPLTILENHLREKANQSPYEASFIGYWAHRLLYYEAEPWVFTLAYSLFGALVLAVFIGCPPRWRRADDPGATSTHCDKASA